MSLELNKAAAAVLTAGLVAMGSGFVADLLTHHEGLEEDAYPIVVAGASSEVEVAEEPALESVLPLMVTADAAAGEGEFRACGACHNIAEGAGNKVGPNLWGVVGRQVASTDFAYQGLAEKSGEEWTYENLNAFLANPKEWAPGTSMSYAGLSDVEDRAALIAYLRSQGSGDYPLPSEDELAALAAEAEAAAEEEMAAEESAEAGEEAEATAEEAAAEEEMAAEEEAGEEMTEEAAAPAAEGPVAMVAAADAAAGEAVFSQCGACHVNAAGASPTVGPNLWGVVGSDIAGNADYPRYSAAFKSYGEGQQWTVENLWEFLEAPMQVVPGTMMAYPGVKDEGDRAALIKYLNEQSDSPLPLE